MGYIYQADVWCNKCGEHIKAELEREGKAPEDPENESSFDSDDYPKHYDAENEESDGPENCADGRCGGTTGGRSWGTFLQNQLTQEGYRYLKSMLDEHGATLPEFAREWAEFYQFEYHAQEWESAHEWLASKSRNQYLLAVIDKLDADQIQDVFEREMDEDGFFKESGWYSSEMTCD
jgi:hypothetical protein